MVAVECPRLARIDSVEGEGDVGHVGHDHGVAHRASEELTIDGVLITLRKQFLDVERLPTFRIETPEFSTWVGDSRPRISSGLILA